MAENYEVEGLAYALASLSAYTYNECPDSRFFVADTIALFDENRRKVWEMREDDLPRRITEAQAQLCIDRLRTIWRDGGSFENDPLPQPDWPERYHKAAKKIGRRE